MGSFKLLLATGLVLGACGRSLPPGAPAPASMLPSTAHTTADVPVVIKGTGFLLTASRRVGEERVGLDSLFQAWLGDTPLSNVAWVDEQTLRAVIPAGLAGDALALTVQGPTGRGLLTGAFRASPLSAPSLAITGFQIPASLSRGQTFIATLDVKNGGQEAAVEVLPDAPATGGAAHASVAAAPTSATVPGGGTVRFTWTLVEDGSATGPLSLTTRATGADPNSLAAIDSPSATSNAAVVQVPAALAVTSLTGPPPLSNGQAFSVKVVVANTGEATAQGVAPVPNPPALARSGSASATVPAALAAVTIAGGQSATFTYDYVENGSGTGSLSFTAGASGTDANTSAALTAVSASASTTVQTPAALALTAFTVRSALGLTSIDRGQDFVASATVSNSGQATATGVLPSPPVVSVTGGAAASTSTAPAAASIAGGSSATFTWAFHESGSGPGTLQYSVSASGRDANSAAVISAAATSSNTLSVQGGPALIIVSVAVPATLDRGQTFALGVTVKNTGGAAASGVLPDPPALALTGGAHASAATTPAAVSLAAGASATFFWSYLEDGTASGTLSFTTRATGTDVNSGTALASAPSTSAAATVQRPAALSISSLTAPAAIDLGQAFSVKVVVANTGEATAQGVAPVPNPPVLARSGSASATV